MWGSDTDSHTARGTRVLLTCLWCAALTMEGSGQATTYVPKNGVLSLKAILIGGGFRVTTAIPLHGDFSKYRRLEIVRCESLIGPDAPEAVLQQITEGLVKEFGKGGRFSGVTVVDSFSEQEAASAQPASKALAEIRDADALDAPMRTRDDLLTLDRQRVVMAHAEDEGASGVLVVKSLVIDYAKGNKWLQLLLLDLGNSVLTVRVSYYDKGTREELGRSVVSSDTTSRLIPGTFSWRTAVTGVAEGLVDQVTRRKVGGER